jgi:hypothetical protein
MLAGITHITFKEAGPAGAKGAIYLCRGEWNDQETYTKTDEVVHYVIYEGYAYEPVNASVTGGNNPLSDVQGGGTNWKALGRYDVVATRVLLANFALIAGAVFWNNKLMSQYGVNNSGAEVSNYDGYSEDANGNENGTFHPNMRLDFLRGYIKSKGAEFIDVLINGSIRSPFVRETDSISINIGGATKQATHDNVVPIGSGGGWVTTGVLEWDAAQSGRRMCLASYRWENQTSAGRVTYAAPSGKYFYEDGISKTSLSISRECVEIMGYGTATTFYGWIVLKRINLMTEGRYGRSLNVLAQGKVTGAATSASIVYRAFDGGSLSVSVVSDGRYRVYFPSSWGLTSSNYIVMLTGFGYSGGYDTAPIKATVTELSSNSFVADTSDDDTRNNGSFFFQIINLDDWT